MIEVLHLVHTIHEKGMTEELGQEIVWLMDSIEKNVKYEFLQRLEGLAYKITPAEAEKIVKDMRPKGQNWTLSQVKEYLKTKGVEDSCVDYYLVMNMCFNDYYDTAKLYGLQSDVEFYYSLAKDFIEDPDAPPHKVEKYFMK